MKMMKNLFFVGIAALTLSLCACNETSESKKSEEPVEEWEEWLNIQEFLIPIHLLARHN